jgi:hypothetical protein
MSNQEYLLEWMDMVDRTVDQFTEYELDGWEDSEQYEEWCFEELEEY